MYTITLLHDYAITLNILLFAIAAVLEAQEGLAPNLSFAWVRAQ